MDKRGQASVEMLVILAVSLIIFAVIFQYSSSAASYADSSLKLLKAKLTVRELVLSADRVYSQGYGARSRVTIYLPGNVNSTFVGNSSIVLRLDTGNGFTDVVGNVRGPVCGHVPSEPGSSIVDIRYLGGCVHIGSAITELSPESLLFSIKLNESNSSFFSATNIIDYPTFLNITFSRGSIPASVNVSINASTASLPAGGSENFNVSVYIPAIAVPGYYSGSYFIETIVNGSVVDSIDLPVDLTILANYTPGAIVSYADVWDLGNVSAGTWVNRSFYVCNNKPVAQNVTFTVGDGLSIGPFYENQYLSGLNLFNATLENAVTADEHGTNLVTSDVAYYDTWRAVIDIAEEAPAWIISNFTASVPYDQVITHAALLLGHYESSTDVEIYGRIWNGSTYVNACTETQLPDRSGSGVESVDQCTLLPYLYSPSFLNNVSTMIFFASMNPHNKQSRINLMTLEIGFASEQVVRGNLTKTVVVEVPPLDCVPVEVYLYTFANDVPGYYSSLMSSISSLGYDVSVALWNVIDDKAPRWSDLFQSPSSVMVDYPVTLGALWTDTGNLGSATLLTNLSGVWADESVMALPGSSAWSNFSFDTSGLCGQTVYWKLRGVDSSYNANVTNVSSFDVISAYGGFNQSLTSVLNGTALDSTVYLNALDSAYYPVLAQLTPGSVFLDSFAVNGSPLLAKGTVSAGVPANLGDFGANTYDIASSTTPAANTFPSSYNVLNGSYYSGSVSNLTAVDAALLYFDGSISTTPVELLNDSSFDSQASIGSATVPWREPFTPAVTTKDYAYDRYDSFEAVGTGALSVTPTVPAPWYKRAASAESWQSPSSYDVVSVSNGAAHTASKGLYLRAREVLQSSSSGTISTQTSSYFWKAPPVMTGPSQVFVKLWQQIADIDTGNQGNGSPLFVGIATEVEGTSSGSTYHLYYYMKSSSNGGSGSPTSVDSFHKWISLGSASPGVWYDANGMTIGSARDIYSDVSAQFGASVANNFQVTGISSIAYEETSSSATTQRYVDLEAYFDDFQLIVRDRIYLSTLDTLDTYSGAGKSLQLLLRAPNGITSETATPSSGGNYYWIGESSSRFLLPSMNTSERMNISWYYHFDSGSDEYLSKSTFTGMVVRVKFTLSGTKYLNYVYPLSGTVPANTSSERWLSLGSPAVSWTREERALSSDILSGFGSYPASIDDLGPYLVVITPSYSDPQNPKFSAHFDGMSLMKDYILGYRSDIEYFFSSVPKASLNLTYVGRYNVSGADQSLYLYNYSSLSYLFFDNFTSGTAGSDESRVIESLAPDLMNGGSVRLLVRSIAPGHVRQGINQINLSTPADANHFTEVYYNSSGITIDPLTVTSLYVPFRFLSTDAASVSYGIYNFTSGAWTDCVSSQVSAAAWNLWYCNVSAADFLSSNRTRVRLFSNATSSHTIQGDYLRFNVSSTDASYMLDIRHSASLPANVTSFNVTLGWMSSANVTYYFDAYNFTGSSWKSCYSGNVLSAVTSTCVLPPNQFINSTSSALVRLRSTATPVNHTSFEDYLQFDLAWC